MPFHKPSQETPLPSRLGAISFFTSVTAAEAATLDPYTTWIVFSGDTIIAGGVTGATTGAPAVFSSVSNAMAATLDAFTSWVVFAGDTKIAGGCTGASSGPPALLNSGLYIPFASMSDGNYGYSIDSGAGILTEDDDGLLVEMTAGTSFEITLTGIDPTTGAHFLIEALRLWLTIGTPSAPTAGDLFFIRQETDATNYSEAALHYDGANWEARASRVEAGAYNSSVLNLSSPGLVAGERIFGSAYTASSGIVNNTARTMHAEFYTDVAVGAKHSGIPKTQVLASDDVSVRANTQIIRIGAEIAAGTWDVRLHGLRGDEHVTTTLGTPF